MICQGMIQAAKCHLLPLTVAAADQKLFGRPHRRFEVCWGQIPQQFSIRIYRIHRGWRGRLLNWQSVLLYPNFCIEKIPCFKDGKRDSKFQCYQTWAIWLYTLKYISLSLHHHLNIQYIIYFCFWSMQLGEPPCLCAAWRAGERSPMTYFWRELKNWACSLPENPAVFNNWGKNKAQHPLNAQA